MIYASGQDVRHDFCWRIHRAFLWSDKATKDIADALCQELQGFLDEERPVWAFDSPASIEMKTP